MRIDAKDLPTLVGKDLGTTNWVSIDQELINRFADVTNDHQWIHVDVDRAKREYGGTTIAHGFLTLSLMSAMSYELLQIDGIKNGINYGFDKLRFTGAVPPDSRVRMKAKMLSVEAKDNSYRFKRECFVELEGHEKPVIVAEWITMVYV
ncbi:putative enoyl-CoA hydratase 1 [Variibacter gotjawalensis]|uniref:Putative enoyl-CoA hydratase 1 n=1 Tax=Variibacter gotjawalensis TaxID=1333996 RepID=A0A0S3PNJ9_9BRAD|nr:MaoC family dehydratase [Variibacter gotjawalensis]NIK47812.1 acyl dehydratase [Variibacter gotjawalensis]RZS49699.1 acyl dehydratase [Variibacter gotjawalensis]BAT57528.1 putative enoyl-CoA hydratase 1 [Variibacter gotjawalensis]